MIRAASTIQKTITAAVVITLSLLETPAPYGHQGITPLYLAVAVSAGLATGLLGSAADRAAGYRQALVERFLIWAAITMVVVYLGGFLLPGLHISAIATAIAAMATALLEILLPPASSR